MKIYQPSKADTTSRNPTPVTTVTIPCIKGTFESLSWILQPSGIHVALKTTTMLQHLLTKVKGSDEPNNREQFTRSKADCQASYINETGRKLNTKLTEHKMGHNKW